MASSELHPTHLMNTRIQQALERPLTAWELKRVERYTSWIRRFVVREWRFSEEIARLFVSMSARSAPVLRLHLRELNLLLHESNLSLFPKLLSPSLTTIVVTANSNELWGEQLYHKMNVTMRSAIMTLPSSLRCLHLQLGSGPQKRFTKEISAFILRCGESFQEFDTNLVLSTQAIVHLMNLPNLRTWVTEQGPPQVTDLINHGVPDGSASLFPSLEALELGGDAAFEWLSLFAALKEHTPPWTMAGNGLRMFAYRNSTASIGSTLLSTLLPLAHLTYVSIQMICWGRPCDSQFTDQDVESLAIALPELQTLELGNFPCGNGTCPTTVRSLLSLSIHCRELRSLSIHFSTENLGVDMLNLLDNTYSQGLHLKSKCSLETLVTGAISFKSADHELVLISIGMLTIFPALARFITRSPCWVQLEDTMETVGRSRESLATTTEDLVRRLNEVKGQAERGGPVRSIVSSHMTLVNL